MLKTMFNNEKKDEELLIAKVNDKLHFCNSKNKISYTDFMQLNEKSVVSKYLVQNRITNYFWYGGINDADREICIFYPDKLSKDIVMSTIDQIVRCVYIKLPNNNHMEHREYLSGIMKLGIAREKFGDIIVRSNGADIISFASISQYFVDELPKLTRFQKAIIEEKSVNEIELKSIDFKELTIIVSSLRLDNIVSELCHCSRNGAQIILKENRVFIDGICIIKESKKVEVGSTITIRGKGKFVFDEIDGNTKSNRLKQKFRKYI